MENQMESQTIPSSIKRNWGWLLALGILMLCLGCLGLSMVIGLTLVSMLFLGVLLVVAGFAQLIDVAKAPHWKASLWHALVAVLYVAVGGVVIYDPILASTVLTAIIASILIVIGLVRFIMALSLKGSKGRGWLFFAGLVSIILGGLILAQWPFSGLWIIGLFIAIEMIVNGWTYILLSFAIRKG